MHHDGKSLVLTGLNCSGPENSLIKCGSIGGTAREVGVSIGAFDSHRLLAEIQEYLLPGRHSVVVEVRVHDDARVLCFKILSKYSPIRWLTMLLSECGHTSTTGRTKPHRTTSTRCWACL